MSELFNQWLNDFETELTEEYMDKKNIASMEAFNDKETYELFLDWAWDKWVEERADN